MTTTPGRDDVVRLLMEPITYANGSTLEDPAITYGIVFSNFMHKGVFTFEGGTDKLITQMKAELERNGVDVRIRCLVEEIEVSSARRVTGVVVNGRHVSADAVLSNANLKSTIFRLVGADRFDPKFIEEARAVRLNNSSCQVYMALKPGTGFDDMGDLLFHSEHKGFDINAMLSRNISSRTFSFYYPKTRPDVRPENERFTIVSSTNAWWKDWGDLDKDGDEDLVIVRKQPWTTSGRKRNVLLMNEKGVLTDRTFSPVTSPAATPQKFPTGENSGIRDSWYLRPFQSPPSVSRRLM